METLLLYFYYQDFKILDFIPILGLFKENKWLTQLFMSHINFSSDFLESWNTLPYDVD